MTNRDAWRRLADDELEREYDIGATVRDPEKVMADYRRRSEAAVSQLGGHLDLAYGTEPRQTLDIFAPADRPAPILVFVHGGYWQGSSKDDRRFPAPEWVRRGVAWVPIEYRLAPDVSLDAIVADVRAAIGWLVRHGARYGCDPSRIHVAGNSAGGHLVAMLLAAGWQEAAGVPATFPLGGCAMSGLFDLAPLVHTSVNRALGLDEPAVRRNSPIERLPPAGTPLVVTWGGRETAEFARQSRDYAEACRAAGCAVTVLEIPEADHFTLIDELARPDSPVFRAVEAQIAASA